MKRLLSLTCLMAAGSLAIAAPVHADPKGHGNGKEHGKKSGGQGYGGSRESHGHERQGGGEGGLNVTIELGDRDYIRHYLSDHYHQNCPPGLAKKHNGCLPPGQAKKRYVIGQPLPEGVFFEPVSVDLLRGLQPAPYGYRYVKVDQDVLLIGEATKHVVDAVTLLSAVGR